MPATREPVFMEASTSTSTTMEQVKPSKSSNKRKRDSSDWNGQGRPKSNPSQGSGGGGNDVLDELLLGEGNALGTLEQQLARHISTTSNGAPSTAAAALAASMPPHMAASQPADMSFQSTNAAANDANDDEPVDSSFDMGGGDASQNNHSEGAPYNLDPYTSNGVSRNQSQGGVGPNKPAVGTEEWHKVRKDNHKEVERRRRETINEGINELAKIVPGTDKNKGAVLQRGVTAIADLKATIKTIEEKHSLEKLLTDQAIQELSTTNDKLKNELERAWKEATRYKKLCADAGLVPKETENGASGAGGNT